ncbi:hypothetical protein HYH02_003282 [Chlamydomonas schloesseri]|uniref:Cilia- and flagella-associated protein 206 n=1 Tax=Chlamydomonas schloesseri TaxID=2026947 RepID=A0A836BA98_9CHLO|nr:hypothetical protein HYH02_003282 [Chlamydomonas schloesseri]|eukprot:KAG2452258.1 hypothetical protein HYH02_003282 [Chlamydomonas schloesseri]
MDDNLKRIVSEATRVCRERGQKVDPYVVAYVTSLEDARGALRQLVPDVSLEAGPISSEAVAVIGGHVASLVGNSRDPRIRTAMMQVLMEVAYKQQRELIEKETAEQQERAGMLQRAVAGPRALRGNTPDAYDKFYKLVLEAVAVEAGLDLAVSDPTANAELRAALESVFPVSAVARFVTLSEGERLTQLAELARICTGICLYNRSCGAGGSALPASAASYLPQAQRLLRDISRCCVEVNEQLAQLQVMLGRLPPQPPAAAAAAGAEGEEGADGAEEPADVAERRRQLHAEILNRGQALQLFESLSADLGEGLEAAQQLDAELEQLLVAVAQAVGGSAAVPKDTVYPLFDRLGALHAGLHQELRLLVVRQRLYDELTELSVLVPGSVLAGGEGGAAAGGKKTTGTSTASAAGSRVASASAAGQPPSAAAAIEALAEQLDEVTLAGLDALASAPPPAAAAAAEGEDGGGAAASPAAAAPALEYIRPASHSQLQPGLALAGFCPGAVGVQPPAAGGVALLRRANPRLGYLAFGDKVYGFSSNAAMRSFMSDPAGVLAGVGGAVAAEPLLARPLGLPPPAPSADVHIVLQAMSGPLKVDFGCQTPVHFLERHIDKDYEWNVWALRRRALALANLRNKATHSAQTAESHFKRENETQVWKPREAVVQTRVTKGQAMPRKLQYVAGLRGAADVKMNVVRLELDLGQPHQH